MLQFISLCRSCALMSGCRMFCWKCLPHCAVAVVVFSVRELRMSGRAASLQIRTARLYRPAARLQILRLLLCICVIVDLIKLKKHNLCICMSRAPENCMGRFSFLHIFVQYFRYTAFLAVFLHTRIREK